MAGSALPISRHGSSSSASVLAEHVCYADMETETSMQTERKRNGKLTMHVCNDSACGPAALAYPNWERVIREMDHILCEIIVKWNRIFQIKYNYAACAKKKARKRKERDGEETT